MLQDVWFLEKLAHFDREVIPERRMHAKGSGAFGTFTVLGMFLSAFLSANWLARHYRGKDRFRTGLFEGLQAGTAVLALSLAHKDFFVVHIAYQTVVYLLIGFIANSWLQVVRVRRPPPSA